MEEIWKDIKDYEGIYQVSNKGRVKSLGNDRKRKEKILKPVKNGKGYLRVMLSKKGKIKGWLVHRLVGDAFITNPFNLPQINHINEIKEDNRVENLEYCDARYNTNFGTAIERRAKTLSKTLTGVYNTKKSKPVKCLETDLIYKSSMDVQRKLGFDNSSITKCCKGKLKTVGKLHWKYVN